MILSSAPAKINLSLEITGRRNDGYHLIRTVMQAINLRERVELSRRSKPGIKLTVSRYNLPLNQKNIAYRAAEAFFDQTGLGRFGLDIKITKHVPVGAGLGGGSADAAAVLVALNELCGIGLSCDDLCKISAMVGADVPFCIMGGTALATGIGTDLERLSSIPECFIVVAKPLDSISTAEAYRLIDSVSTNYKSSAVEDGIDKGDLYSIAQGLFNNFDMVINLPGVEKIKNIMKNYDVLGCQMTGSGSAVFGIFEYKQQAETCAAELRNIYNDVFVCRPDFDGARIEKIKK
jgi:4-diphosphocytidyl-2-C-methyl-D-erythritol kinase